MFYASVNRKIEVRNGRESKCDRQNCAFKRSLLFVEVRKRCPKVVKLNIELWILEDLIAVMSFNRKFPLRVKNVIQIFEDLADPRVAEEGECDRFFALEKACCKVTESRNIGNIFVVLLLAFWMQFKPFICTQETSVADKLNVTWLKEGLKMATLQRNLFDIRRFKHNNQFIK